jgi:hypothetical protein
LKYSKTFIEIINNHDDGQGKIEQNIGLKNESKLRKTWVKLTKTEQNREKQGVFVWGLGSGIVMHDCRCIYGILADKGVMKSIVPCQLDVRVCDGAFLSFLCTVVCVLVSLTFYASTGCAGQGGHGDEVFGSGAAEGVEVHQLNASDDAASWSAATQLSAVKDIAPATVYVFMGDPLRLHADIRRAVKTASWGLLHVKPNKWPETEQMPTGASPVRGRALLADSRELDVAAWGGNGQDGKPGREKGVSRIYVAVRVGYFGDPSLEKHFVLQLAKVMKGRAKPKRNRIFRLPVFNFGKTDQPSK